MELHAFDREALVAQAHDLALGGPRGDLELGGQAVARRRSASDSAWRGTGSAGRRTRRGRRARSARCGRASGAARARRCRRRPGRSPGGRGTRRGSGACRANARRSPRSVTPASSGVPGPGEIRMPSGARRAMPSHVDRVVAKHFDRRAELPEVLHEVVGERVVVIDHEDHRRLHPMNNFSCAGASDAVRALARRSRARRRTCRCAGSRAARGRAAGSDVAPGSSRYSAPGMRCTRRSSAAREVNGSRSPPITSVGTSTDRRDTGLESAAAISRSVWSARSHVEPGEVARDFGEQLRRRRPHRQADAPRPREGLRASCRRSARATRPASERARADEGTRADTSAGMGPASGA